MARIMEHHAMVGISLREAAEQTGLSKSTLFRAIRAGRLSATRTEDGQFLIDPSELFRVYEPKTQGDAATCVETRTMVHHATVDQMVEMRVRNAQLESEIKVMREMLDEARRHAERWAAQAERLALAAPQPKLPRRSWWPWRRTD